MTIPEQIDSIIAKRKAPTEQVVSLVRWIDQVELGLSGFRTFSNQFSECVDAETSSKIQALEPEIDRTLTEIAKRRSELLQLQRRFERTTLNIGVAGLARQGKSTFLQNLTGLGGDVIPSGELGHCTGAASSIVNRNGTTVDAEIEFHSEYSFLGDIVAPFVRELGLANPPATLDDFLKMRIEAAPSGTALDGAKLERLRHYQRGLPHYRSLLGAPTRVVGRDEIRNYVAQRDAEEKPLLNWIAVRRVIIYCPFPNRDAGRIALLDTPGLGDFISGSEERLIKTVGENLDVALFVRMPKEKGEAGPIPSDVALYDMMARALPDVPLSEWSFFIVNNTGNDRVADFFLCELNKTETYKIVTAGSLKVNCASPVDSQNALSTVLDYLIVQIEKIDHHYLVNCLQRVDSVRAKIGSFVESASKVLPKIAMVGSEENTLDGLFGSLWTNLGHKLNILLSEYWANRNNPDADFVSNVEDVFMQLNVDSILPEVETINRESSVVGLQVWHGEKLHELRDRIARSLFALNDTLSVGMDQMRDGVKTILCEDDGGRLGRLRDLNGDTWWVDLEKIFHLYDGSDAVCESLHAFSTAQISVRGFLQHRIRLHLDVLDSRSKQAATYAFVPGDEARIVREKLELAWEEAIYRVRNAIREMSKEPNQARFALLEEFIDGILRANGPQTMVLIWKNFYRQERGSIWSETFDSITTVNRLRKQWDNALKKLAALSSEMSQ